MKYTPLRSFPSFTRTALSCHCSLTCEIDVLLKLRGRNRLARSGKKYKISCLILMELLGLLDFLVENERSVYHRLFRPLGAVE